MLSPWAQMRSKAATISSGEGLGSFGKSTVTSQWMYSLPSNRIVFLTISSPSSYTLYCFSAKPVVDIIDTLVPENPRHWEMIGGVCAAGGAIAIGVERGGRCRVEESGVRARRRRSSRCAIAMLGFLRGFRLKWKALDSLSLPPSLSSQGLLPYGTLILHKFPI